MQIKIPPRLLKPDVLIPVYGLWCAVAGGVTGYKIAQRRLTKVYEAKATEEIDEARKWYSVAYEKPSLEDLAANAQEALNIYSPAALDDIADEVRRSEDASLESQATAEAMDEDDEVLDAHRQEKINIFTQGGVEDEWDWDEEYESRGQRPYVIHLSEWNENDPEHEQAQLTFYEGGDGTLADEADQPIVDSDEIVANINLTKFGHGSGDHNKVYVRNEELQTDFEIVRSFGSFAKEVLGFDDELSHSDDRRPRRMRSERATT